MMLLRLILLPFTLIYAIAILIRMLLYRSGLLTRMSFDIPIVCVGNISAGGTGKTPHIEWLIGKLQDELRLAVLSRGYKRKTTGYVFAGNDATTEMIGDEPFQIYRKFRNVAVAVAENRVLGVPDLLTDAPETQMILMDDGFQHLPIRAGFNIVLTPYSNRYTKDWLLPSGRLREFRGAAKRAEVIVVTKCPAALSASEKGSIKKEIDPLPGQLVLFSKITYAAELYPVFENGTNPVPLNNQLYKKALLFSGIADPSAFEKDMGDIFEAAEPLRFSDHHNYTESDLQQLADRFRGIAADGIIITTEKDAVKLREHPQSVILSGLPVFYLPLEADFDDNDGAELLHSIRQFVLTFEDA